METNNLTMKDLATVEELTGVSMDLWEGSPKAKLTAALAFVSARKDNPELTWDEVLDWKIEDINKYANLNSPKAKRS
ncbi:MAG: hypothetical protein EBR38_08380 [Flavobacteriaceae bacterium]|nr:hypothetical protein [Flavobacteriaceae bacterium]